MKLEKAIEVNKDSAAFFESDGFTECADAVELGNEALKREQERRHFFAPNIMNILPGED